MTETAEAHAERSTSPTITCIVVSWHSGEVLPDFLDTLHAAQPGMPVVVVNNDITDPEPAGIVAGRDGVVLVQSEKNLGYGGGMNLGVSHSSPSEWLLIANPDIRVAPDAIARLVEAIHDDPRAGAVGPRLLNVDGTTYPSARSLPTLRTGIGHALFSRRWPNNRWTTRYHAFRDLSMSEPTVVGWLSGAFLMVRRDLYVAMGGFDEGFLMYFEDTDLGRRIAAAGWHNLYVPAASVTHLGGHSTQDRKPQMVRAHHRSAYRYLAITHPQRWLFPLRWALWIGLEIRGRWTSRH